MAELNPIARIRSAFPTKFGIPRQSGLVDGLKATIVFEPKYREAEALRGLDEYSHIWLIWDFSESGRDTWSPTVRPPRLGGNVRMGVFATRSPYRPNSIGLSCVKIDSIELSSPEGPLIHVLGADLMDGTPIYDIKPYVAYSDSHPEATGGFTSSHPDHLLQVEIDEKLCKGIDGETLDILRQLLSRDPRPSYQRDPERVYGMEYENLEIKFTVSGEALTVTEITKRGNSGKDIGAFNP